MELHSVFNIADLSQYKLHAARSNKVDQPLDVYLRSKEEWNSWNSWRGYRDDFNRDFIFSIIKFYPEEDTWLFGGIYQVIARGREANHNSYQIKQIALGQELIGRLKFRGSLPRGRAFNLENCRNHLQISELLREPYTGEQFSGYQDISLDYPMLEIIYKNGRIDWQTALSSVAGIYLIADKLTGKKYVGSAYGSEGIWSRWKNYIENGHGWNKMLVGLNDVDLSYARANFKITLLECFPAKVENSVVFDRENFWKEALLTRRHGYNGN
jgi:hypothetical protein